jgi:hypothetical protein
MFMVNSFKISMQMQISTWKNVTICLDLKNRDEYYKYFKQIFDFYKVLFFSFFCYPFTKATQKFEGRPKFIASQFIYIYL